MMVLTVRRSRAGIACSGLAALVLAASPARAAAPICAAPAEATALAGRLVQTELMIAALSCDAQARYNAFVRRFQPELAASNKRLVDFFRRHYGPQGFARTNDYVTRTANETSERSLRQIDDFCAAAARTFDAAERVDQRAFAGFVGQHPAASAIGYPVCPAPAKGREAKNRKTEKPKA